MGERVPVDQFLAELEEDFDEAFSMAGAGHPAEYGIRRALINQRKEYVLNHFRKIFERTGQKEVRLPDATVTHENGASENWCREDWNLVDDIREDWDR
jgi:hypothetical protein